mmetsp:Transcript_103973/g.298862  ORF Transcript_103973/g.298862 Transcript_103973/m.298862 type:complete len:641 (-) Transcript_103973:42-1964(-)
MLGGLKAALGGARRGPVLPLSGVHVVHHHSRGSASGSSRGFSSASYDEETPEDRSRPSPIGFEESPRKFCELGGPYVDVEAGARIGTASTAAPPSSAGTTASSAGQQTPLRCGSFHAAGGEERIGFTQLVLSLDLDILGPTGLLAQLGFTGQHELESNMLRVQCSGMEVHHRTTPDSARTPISHRSAGRRSLDEHLGSIVSSEGPSPAPVDCAKALSFTAGAGVDAQQFYIGESDCDQSMDRAAPHAGGGHLPNEFAELFAPQAPKAHVTPKRRKRASRVSPQGQDLRSGESSDDSGITGATAIGRFSGDRREANGRRELPLQRSMVPGASWEEVGAKSPEPQAQRSISASSLREAARPTSGASNSSLAPAPSGSAVPGISGLEGGKPRPATRKPNGGKAEELHELQELRKSNLRLERDLYDTLQALEEESFTSSPSSRSDSSCESQLPSPKPVPLTAKKMLDLQVSTGRPTSAAEASPPVVDTPPMALCGSALPAASSLGEDECCVQKGSGNRRIRGEANVGPATRPPLSKARPQLEGGASSSNLNSACMQTPPLHSSSSSSASRGTGGKRRPEKAMLVAGVQGEAQAQFHLGTPGHSSEEEDDGTTDLKGLPNSIFRGSSTVSCSSSSATQRAQRAQS